MQGTSHALQSSSQDRALAKLHAQAAQWEDEYEDEYDDSFDDLAGFDADPNAEADGELCLHLMFGFVCKDGVYRPMKGMYSPCTSNLKDSCVKSNLFFDPVRIKLLLVRFGTYLVSVPPAIGRCCTLLNYHEGVLSKSSQED